MYGLRGINNIYVPNGTGRDSIITRSQDFNKGKVYSPSVNKSSMAAAGLPCQPPPRSHGPRPLSPARLDGMVKGKRHEVKAPTKRSSSVSALVEKWSQAPGAYPFISPIKMQQRQRVEPLEGWASAASWSPAMAKGALASVQKAAMLKA
mmetsp:Transcript_55388/g.121160  ORF Transcript_55388/g.121160 Transcript_55388/m.121160 type:complete len:149 (+) Transcript_55388:42-488(+)